jgi:signal transduction histidine kinase
VGDTQRRIISGGVIAGLIGLYWGLGWLAFNLGEPIDYSYKAVLWPPVGLGVAILLIGGLRFWPVILLGEFVTRITLGVDRVVALEAATAFAATVGTVLSAALLLKVAGPRPSLERPATVGSFMVLSAAIGPLATALLGTWIYGSYGIIAWSDSPYVLWAWWSGDLVSILILTPWLMSWRQPAPHRWSLKRLVELVTMFVVLMLVCGFVFAGLIERGSYDYPLTYLPVLVIAWGIARFGFREATTALLLVAVAAVWGTLNQIGPFVGATRFESILLLQGFLGTVAAATLSLSAFVVDRHNNERELARRQAELDSARELDRLKDDMLNATTHELRTPLAAIIGNAELLEDGVPERPTTGQLTIIKGIQAGARRLDKLVNDLLLTSGIAAGKLSLNLQALELDSAMVGWVAGLEEEARGRGVALTYLGSTPLWVLADEERLSQAMFQLLDNAIKFTAEGGTITITLGSDGRQARIEIRDTGIGIAPEHLERVFNRFYQAEASLTRSQGGAGLGLAIARSLIEAQAGQIGVESQPEVGSTFWITLPLAAAASPGHRGADAHEPGPAGSDGAVVHDTTP